MLVKGPPGVCLECSSSKEAASCVHIFHKVPPLLGACDVVPLHTPQHLPSTTTLEVGCVRLPWKTLGTGIATEISSVQDM